MEGALLGLLCKHRAPFEGGRVPPGTMPTPLATGGQSPRPTIKGEATPLDGAPLRNRHGRAVAAPRGMTPCRSGVPNRLAAIRNGHLAGRQTGHRGCFGRNRLLRGFCRDNRRYADCRPSCSMANRGGAFDRFRVATGPPNACRGRSRTRSAICCRVGYPTRDCGEFSRP